MPNGRLEARYLLTSPWTGTISNSLGGLSTWTVAAGAYYATALAAAFQAAFRAVVNPFATWTVTIASGESGTGRVTIDKGAAGAWSLNWTSTDARDALGFTAAIAAVTVPQTGPNAMLGLWLPDSPIDLPSLIGTGFLRSDLRQSKSRTGAVYSIGSSTYREIPNVRWSHVSRARAFPASTALMDWDTFCDHCFFGSKSYITPCRIALYSDATNNTLVGPYAVVGVTSSEVVRPVQSWDGLWSVFIPSLIRQAS